MRKYLSTLLVSVTVADIRGQASHTSELLTQAVLGVELERIRTTPDGKWHRVRLPDGYVGWVRGWSVLPVSSSKFSDWNASLAFQVSSRSAVLRERPSSASRVACELALGTRIPGLSSRAGWVRTALPDSRRGWLERKELEGLARPGPTAAAIMKTTLLFMGTPYLWGGTTPWGCDCSGLVQTVYSLNGITLPRDAGEQLRSLRSNLIDIEAERCRRGDLLFFGPGSRSVSHVAISAGGTSFIHAHGHVQEGNLKRGQVGYVPELSRCFRVAARPFGKRKKNVDKKSGLQ